MENRANNYPKVRRHRVGLRGATEAFLKVIQSMQSSGGLDQAHGGVSFVGVLANNCEILGGGVPGKSTSPEMSVQLW